jgi:hypothetical protein
MVRGSNPGEGEIYSPSWPSWPVIGRILYFFLFLSNTMNCIPTHSLPVRNNSFICSQYCSLVQLHYNFHILSCYFWSTTPGEFIIKVFYVFIFTSCFEVLPSDTHPFPTQTLVYSSVRISQLTPFVWRWFSHHCQLDHFLCQIVLSSLLKAFYATLTRNDLDDHCLKFWYPL